MSCSTVIMDKLLIFFGLLCIAMADEMYYGWEPHYVRTPLGDSIDISTMKVLKAAYEGAKDKNIVSSPLGLMMLLSLYNEGTGPDAKNEINKFLGGTDSKQITNLFKDLNDKFSVIDPDSLSIADKIAVSNQYSLNKNFASAARDYHCDISTMDFTKPGEAVAEINKWASEKTKGHIKNPVNEDMFNADVAVALFNVIFFNGHWNVPFKAEETEEKDFHISRDSVVKKPMMHLFSSLPYTWSDQLDARMIELPYKEKGFRMIVVLPNKVDGLPSVLERAATKGLLTDVFNLRMPSVSVDLDMPKFDIRTGLDFNEILPKVGVSKLFGEGAPGIVANASVTVTKAFQEAFIKVNEEGATAGAFTGMIVENRELIGEPPQPLKFFVDHPFIYAILYNDTILFAGMIMLDALEYPEPEPLEFYVDHPFIYAILHNDTVLFADMIEEEMAMYPEPPPLQFYVDHPFIYAILHNNTVLFAGIILVQAQKDPEPQPLQFYVDHPFIYAILYNDTILFAGTYSE